MTDLDVPDGVAMQYNQKVTTCLWDVSPQHARLHVTMGVLLQEACLKQLAKVRKYLWGVAITHPAAQKRPTKSPPEQASCAAGEQRPVSCRSECCQWFAAADQLCVPLQNEARRVMEQLRLACLHPQMTMYWRGLANELQLTQVRCHDPPGTAA